MADTKELKDKLLVRLSGIVETEEELQPAMVSAIVNFLKAFPPAQELEDLPTAKKIASSLSKYKATMPFDLNKEKEYGS
tara:strand:+ start:3171 stop:3407 length:237 start_codon:yes stop_codon:yes gene_type:complete